jgi:organic radical activating enzyme
MYKLEVELTTFCNLFCPGCLRYKFKDNTLYKTNEVIYNQFLDVNIFKENLFKGSNAFLWKSVECIGTYGDPLGHKDIAKFCEIMLLSNPKITFFFHTNGTLGNEDTWKNLAKFCNASNRYITFSVDDIGEDNSKYRIGQTWDLIVRNMQTFINAGGVAEWKMVVFKHNKHKIDELKKVSQQLGFKKFRSVLDYEDCDERIKILNGIVPKKISVSKVPRQAKDRIPKNHNVECQSLINKMMYLTANGNIVPCCMWNASSGQKRKQINEWIGGDWNNTLKHDIKDILEHNTYKTKLLDMTTNAPLDECYISCDKHVGGATTYEHKHVYGKKDDLVYRRQ